MAFEKVVLTRLAGVTSIGVAFKDRLTQPTAATGHSHMRIAITGFTSSSGDDAAGRVAANKLSGTLFWDTCNYYLTGVSLSEATSFVVVIESDALDGFTGLPIAGVSLSTGSVGVVPVPKFHNGRGSLMPTHVNFIRTTATAGSSVIQCQVWAVAKASRGTLSTSGGKGKGADRVLQGEVWSAKKNLSTDFIDADATFTMTAGGASASFAGLDKMALWDQACFWFVGGATVTGSWQAHIIGTAAEGTTYVIAETINKKLNGTSNAFSFPRPAVPMFNYFAGTCPKPSHVIITEVDVSASGISESKVIMVAKSNRGTHR